ncbi:MAG TPA: serine/threonine-protein kinase [Kofleriaceae bacterium]|nr:serine/threonine-protein kinase [Kofleriaceae bacterium]
MVPGTQVGVYRLLQQIGEGGMGAVWMAEHTMLGRRAAIKLLHPMFNLQQDIVTRFFNEARAATTISDPGIVQIFDFGHHVDGTAYIAMEMLDGEPLDKRLARLGRLAVGDAMRIMRQVASTLGVAHARGIVHRDLKPENVFLVRDPEVFGGERAKVLDFGIAKLTGEAGSHTSTSAVMGTPAYMSPEQCRGAGHVDQRSDVYSIGCMMYTLVTGALVFPGQGSGEIIAMHLREAPVPPSQRAPDLPLELDALILRCLAKDPAQRFASGTELAAAIGAWLGTASAPGLANATAPPYAQRAVAPAGTTLSSSSGVAHVTAGPKPASSGKRMALIAGGVVVAAGVAVAVVMQRTADRPAAVAVTAPPPPAPAPVAAPAPPPPAPAPAAAKPDPTVELVDRMKTELSRFLDWSRDHAQAACPTGADLGAPVHDPWGHALVITCTDQPANQIVGVISVGPDGIAGNADDVGSWQLGREVTDLVHGARWAPKPAAPTPPPVTVKRRPRPQPEDDIPAER